MDIKKNYITMKIFVIYLLFILLTLNLFSIQNYEQELREILKQERSGNSEKVKLKSFYFNKLSEENLKINPEKSIIYGIKAAKYAQKYNLPLEEIKAYHNIAKCYINLEVYDIAKDYLTDAYEKSVKLNNYKFQLTSNILLGNLYQKWNKLDKAIYSYNEALEVIKNSPVNAEEVDLFCKIGEVLNAQNNYELSNQYFNKALLVYTRDKRFAAKNNTLLAIANNYYEMGDLEQVNNILKQISLKPISKTYIPHLIPLKIEIADLYININENDEAISILLEIIESKHLSNSHNDLFNIYKKLSKAYFQKESFKSSLKYLNLCLSFPNINEAETLGLYKTIFLVNEANCQYHEAYKFKRKYISLKEDIIEKNSSQKFEELIKVMNIEKQEKSNNLLKQEIQINDLKLSKEGLVKNFLLIFTFIVLVSSSIFVFLFYSKIKLNKILVERNDIYSSQKIELSKSLKKLEDTYEKVQKIQNDRLKLEEKNSALAVAVTANHELNQPLMVMLGNVELLKMKAPKIGLEEKDLKYLDKIENSLNMISKYLEDLKKKTSIELKNIREDIT